MAERAPMAAWASLFVSLITLMLLVTVIVDEPDADPRPADRINEVLAILEGDSTFGTAQRGGLVGDLSDLETKVGDLTNLLVDLQAEMRDATTSSETAGSLVEEALSEIETVSARLSDICFRLDAC